MSTTQVLCGAIFAVGLFEGGKGLNWRMALKVGPSVWVKRGSRHIYDIRTWLVSIKYTCVRRIAFCL